jgi:hypothetical protein
MTRISEIIANIRHEHPNDDFFSDFENSCRIEPTKRKYYHAYNKSLMAIDEESWLILKGKALQHYLNHRSGQRKQGFFNQLNEAFAYRYLVSKGFKDVRFIKEGKGKKPDIKFTVKNTQNYCEVKTLGISNDEINRRSTIIVYDGSVYVSLGKGFLNKFNDAFTSARQQIYSLGPNGLVYIIILFDDMTLDYYQDYRKQLITFSKNQGFDNLYIKIGLLGNRRIRLTSQWS